MPKIAAVILVGGKACRLNGQNKCDLMVGRKTCLEWTLELFREDIQNMALSVGQTDRFGHAKDYQIIFDWPHKHDDSGVAFAILGSLAWAMNNGYEAIITVPVDTPHLSKSYSKNLIQHYNEQQPVVFETPEGLQGLHAIWPVKCFEEVKKIIVGGDIRKISLLHNSLKSEIIHISGSRAEQFQNINTAESLETARKYIEI